jgi:hypothetical protein
MGLFFNRGDKQQKQQRIAEESKLAELQHQKGVEMEAKREQVVVRFDGGISSLAPVFEEAMDQGHGASVTDHKISIQRSLFLDLLMIVANIAKAIDDDSLTSGGSAAASYAYSILTRAAPDALQHYAVRDGVEFSQCGIEMIDACEFCNPGTLTVMQEYDTARGTLYSYAVADLFLAFMLELEATPALKGVQILEAYVSMLSEYIAKKPSAPLAQSADAPSRTLEADETLAASTREELALTDTFREIADDGAVLAYRLYCRESNSGGSTELSPERLLILDVTKIIYTMARATSEPISDRHARLLKLIGQAVDPIAFNTYSIKICSDFIVNSNEVPHEGLWEPMILQILARHDEQNHSKCSELPRRGFEMLVSAMAGLSSNAEAGERVIRRYNNLLKPLVAHQQ